jgi:hypothetical protein
LVDLTVGWLFQELKNDENWPKLEEFLNGRFRRDMINLSLYAWVLQFSEPKDGWTTAVCLVEYLVEHGYLTPQDIPTLLRAFKDAQQEDYERLLAWGRRLLATRMNGNLPDSTLEFLTSREKLAASLSAYLENTPEYQRLLGTWEKERLGTKPAPPRPEPPEVIGELLKTAAVGALQLGGDQLSVTMKTGRPAVKTNGEWSKDSQDIRWPRQLLPPDEMNPLLHYAVWVEPNIEVQTRHFGEAVLAGESLLQYCVWYHGLSNSEQQEWDAFLETLKPNTELVSQLTDFRFAHEPADRQSAAPVLEILIPAINPSVLKEN